MRQAFKNQFGVFITALPRKSLCARQECQGHQHSRWRRGVRPEWSSSSRAFPDFTAFYPAITVEPPPETTSGRYEAENSRFCPSGRC